MLEQALRRGDVDREERVGAVRERHVRLREMDDRVDLGQSRPVVGGEIDDDRRPAGDPRAIVARGARRRARPAERRDQVRRDEARSRR